MTLYGMVCHWMDLAKFWEAKYERAQMIADSASAMADYRMYRIFELEAEIERLKNNATTHHLSTKVTIP